MSATTAPKWFKSSYSGSEGGACVEVAKGPTQIHVRDSKVTGGPVLTLNASTWAGLTTWLSAS
ncbi:DUF397 domain-containing protein [Streptomyces sp. NPDC058646]|uniref:DUF397 domain-containing protein n=1 Tax=Streptomyces sp. NPDC058646 TaxID=3346574 RepID=UPI00364E2550